MLLLAAGDALLRPVSGQAGDFPDRVQIPTPVATKLPTALSISFD